MRTGTTYKQKETTLESLTLKGKMEVDPNLRASLTDADEGILRPGALPSVPGICDAGNKALLGTFDQARSWHSTGGA